jgi:hypothetical protein
MDELTLDEAMEDMEYIAKAAPLPEDEAQRRIGYTDLLEQAYEDFVLSDALTEKVFKVFHMHEPQTAFVPLSSIGVMRRDVESEMFQVGPEAGGCGCGGSCHSSEAALGS